MEEKGSYVKRTQRDYPLTFKLNVVREIESAGHSTTEAYRKYGIQSRSTSVTWLRKYGKIKLLEKQKVQFERQNYIADSKVIIFDMILTWRRRNTILM